ncbi:5065_t:CDS:2, partial [Acaulospora morrowiae]
FNDEQGIPASTYFSSKMAPFQRNTDLTYYNGVKIFYYIPILLTLVDAGIYVIRHFRFRNGPFKRDISINAFFAGLWLSSSIANLYPTFEGHTYTCDNNLLIQNTSYAEAITRECNTKVISISFGWIVSCLFFLTTFIAYKLWIERKEMYEGERRVEKLDEVNYKYVPKPNLMVQLDEPEQIMTFKTYSKSELKKGQSLPTLQLVTSPRSSFSD